MENKQSIIQPIQKQILGLRFTSHGRRVGVTQELKIAILSAFEGSHLSVSEFCHPIGISVSIFYKYQGYEKHLYKIKSKTQSFERIQVQAQTGDERIPSSPLVLKVPTGYK